MKIQQKQVIILIIIAVAVLASIHIIHTVTQMSVNLKEVGFSHVIIVPANSHLSDHATCPAGSTISNFGWMHGNKIVDPVTRAGLYVDSSFLKNPTNWITMYVNPLSTDATVNVSWTCEG